MVPAWTLADRLRKARESANLSQLELGEKLEVSNKVIGNIERGTTPTKNHMIISWAMVTMVDEEWLRTGKGGPDGPPPGDKLPDLDSNQEPSGLPTGSIIAFRPRQNRENQDFRKSA